MTYHLIFCFSGQGSQYYRMGKELYVQDPVFKSWMNRLDEIAHAAIGESVISVLYNENAKTGDAFDRTLITHPAIFMFEYSLYKVCVGKGMYPDYVLGSSLGEYTAAAVSGILDYENVLKMIINQAVIIERTCPKGGMMVLLTGTGYFNEMKEKYPDIELASVNSDNHFVISGPQDTLVRIERNLRNKDIIAQILPVSHGFHSSLIDPAGREYSDYLHGFEYKKPSIQYISSVTGTILESPDRFEAGYFWDVCRKPIMFQKTIENTEQHAPLVYLDLGPSGTLSNLAKLNLKPASESRVIPIVSPFGRDISNLEKAMISLNSLPFAAALPRL